MHLKYKSMVSTVILSLFLCTPGFHNKNTDSPDLKAPFDMKQFNKRYQTALYLLQYDMAAWGSSDSVMKEPESVKNLLGKEWFCVKIEEDWHAVYGRYDTISHSFIQILHYTIAKNGAAVKTDQVLDSTISNPAARSVRTCLIESDSLISFWHSYYVNFNAYYQKDGLGNHAWLLPGSTDEKAVYGIDLSFDLTPSGDSIIHKEILGQKLRYYIPSKTKEAIVGNDFSDVPTIGNIFYAMHHHGNFKNVVIHNKKWESSLIVNPQTSEFSWMHVLRQEKNTRARNHEKSPMPEETYRNLPDERPLYNPKMNSLDKKIISVVKNYKESDSAEKHDIRKALSKDEIATLLLFSKRSSIFAIRLNDFEYLLGAIEAIGMIEAKRCNNRDILASLSLLNYAGKKLKADVDEFFLNVANESDKNTSGLIRGFIKRSNTEKDITKSWGFFPIETENGPGFLQTDFEKHIPLKGR